MCCRIAPAGTARSRAARPSDSTLLIDATLKARRSAARAADARVHGDAHADLGRARLPALSPQPPWHGYTLGDWTDNWETFAQRAVNGDWERSGKETFARRRGGVTPETPVRDAEGKKK